MPESKSYPFSFTGRGSEYFKIWIVNILLNIVTLSLYSSWAKVRTQRWFYGHTVLDSQPFTYLATPMQLFKGRLIALAVLIVYMVCTRLFPLGAILIAVALVIATPWLLVAALRFHARMSAYRGIRFDFTGGVKGAAVVFLLLPLLVPFTLGLILPYIAYRQVRYIVDNSRYGDTVGCFKGSVKQYAWVYLVAAALLLTPFLLALALVWVWMGSSDLVLSYYFFTEESPAAFTSLIVLGVLLFYAVMLVVVGYTHAHLGNLHHNGSYFGEVGFESRLRARSLIWLYLSNVVLVYLTIGLFYPWARVRLARYRAEQLTVHSQQALDVFTGARLQNQAAAGSELADALDLSVGLQ